MNIGGRQMVKCDLVVWGKGDRQGVTERGGGS